MEAAIAVLVVAVLFLLAFIGEQHRRAAADRRRLMAGAQQGADMMLAAIHHADLVMVGYRAESDHTLHLLSLTYRAAATLRRLGHEAEAEAIIAAMLKPKGTTDAPA